MRVSLRRVYRWRGPWVQIEEGIEAGGIEALSAWEASRQEGRQASRGGSANAKRQEGRLDACTK
jgi:hypothetical protein